MSVFSHVYIHAHKNISIANNNLTLAGLGAMGPFAALGALGAWGGKGGRGPVLAHPLAPSSPC